MGRGGAVAYGLGQFVEDLFHLGRPGRLGEVVGQGQGQVAFAMAIVGDEAEAVGGAVDVGVGHQPQQADGGDVAGLAEAASGDGGAEEVAAQEGQVLRRVVVGAQLDGAAEFGFVVEGDQIGDLHDKVSSGKGYSASRPSRRHWSRALSGGSSASAVRGTVSSRARRWGKPR